MFAVPTILKLARTGQPDLESCAKDIIRKSQKKLGPIQFLKSKDNNLFLKREFQVSLLYDSYYQEESCFKSKNLTD